MKLLDWWCFIYCEHCRFCEDVQRLVGFDWLLVFMQSHVHQSTIILAMSILVRMLQQQTLLQCFRDGSSPSGWLTDTECVVQNRIGVLLGEQEPSVYMMLDNCGSSLQFPCYL